MQEFSFCGVSFDFVQRSKTVAVRFFLLKVKILVFDIHHEAIDIDKVIVSLIQVDAPTGIPEPLDWKTALKEYLEETGGIE